MKKILYLLIGLFFVINKMSKKFKFNKLMIISIFIGLGLGILIQSIAKFPKKPSQITWINEVTTWYGLFGNGFACPPDHLCVRRVLHRRGHFESPETRQRLCHRKR